MIRKLCIILLFLHQSCGCPIVESIFDSNRPKTTNHLAVNDKWMVNFVLTGSNKYESCQVMPIKRRIFISDGECIYHAAKKDHWAITIDFFHGSTRYVDMAYVQDKNIFYNEHLSREYNPNDRKIAILIADQPVFSKKNRSLLLGTVQLAYEEVETYCEENQIKKITYNMSDTNYSKCFMPIFNSKELEVSCYGLDESTTSCLHTFTDVTLSQYNNVLDYLICHTKRSKQKLALVGVLSRKRKPDINGRTMILEYENVDDLYENIFRKMQEWFAENPGHKTYSLY